MAYNILICGAGQLGSRYLQGIASLCYSYNVYVQDISEESIDRSKKRWNEVKKNKYFKKIFFIKSLEIIPSKIDFAIVSSISSSRLEIIKNIINSTRVNYWILEKILAQNELDVKLITSLLSKSGGAWVNKPRRVMKWHQEIKSKIDSKEKISVEIVGGNWGLLSNSIHFIDLISWWTKSKLINIDSSQLNTNWFESKRSGFYESYGSIICEFKNGSILNISCNNDDSSLLINVSDKNYNWKISESQGNAFRSDGLKIQGRIEMQSQITSKIISDIIKSNDCDLPKLNDSAEMHCIYLNNILNNFNDKGNLKSVLVPIT
tara:strand:+ start:36 stop:992 length:957 start_codon:yes stop_codon:yes gene_type:complete